MTYRPKLWTGLAAVAVLGAAGLTGCKTDDWNGGSWERHGERGERGDRRDRDERGWDRGERGDRDRGERRGRGRRY